MTPQMAKLRECVWRTTRLPEACIVDSSLLEFLCCPDGRSALRMATPAELAAANAKILLQLDLPSRLIILARQQNAIPSGRRLYKTSRIRVVRKGSFLSDRPKTRLRTQ